MEPLQFPAVAIRDPRNEVRLHPDALVGKGAVGRGHLQQGDPAGAERDREHREEFPADPQPAGQRHDVLGTDVVDHADRRDVAGPLEGVPHGDPAAVFAVVVPGFVGLVADRINPGEGLVEQERGRREPPGREGGAVGERLERRPRLAARLDGPVELAALEVEPSDHGLDGAGVYVERQEGAFGQRLLLEPHEEGPSEIEPPLLVVSRGLRPGFGVVGQNAEPSDVPDPEELLRGPEGPGKRTVIHSGAVVRDPDLGLRPRGGDHPAHHRPDSEGSAPRIVLVLRGLDSLVQDVPREPPESLPLVVGAKRQLHRFGGGVLHSAVQRRMDAESAAVGPRVPVVVAQVAAHHLHEMGGETVPPAGAEPDRLGPRRVGFLHRQELLGNHPLENHVAPALGRLHAPERVEGGRVGRHPDQHGGLSDREFGGPLAQIELGRRFDPLVVVSEVHLVRVEGEDLLLAVGPLDPEGGDRLLDLAFEGLFAVQEELARDLLRDGAGAGDDPARPVVVPDRPGDPDGVEPEVAPETLVLGRHQRVPKVLREFFVLHLGAAFDGELPDFDAVAVVHDGGGRAFVAFEFLDQRDVALVGGEQPEHRAGNRGRAEQEDHDQGPRQLTAPHRPARRRSGAGHSVSHQVHQGRSDLGTPELEAGGEQPPGHDPLPGNQQRVRHLAEGETHGEPGCRKDGGSPERLAEGLGEIGVRDRLRRREVVHRVEGSGRGRQQVDHRGRHVVEVNPGHPLAPAPEPPAHSHPERGQHGGERSAARREHHADPQRGHLDPLLAGGGRRVFPLRAHLGEEAVPRGGLLIEFLVAARPVVPHRGSCEQARGPAPGGAEGRHQRLRTLDPALANGALSGSGPAFPDRRAGEVDEGVQLFEHPHQPGVGSVTTRAPLR